MASASGELALQNVSPDPQVLGTLNAVAGSCSSVVKTVTPAASAAVFAIGVRGQRYPSISKGTCIRNMLDDKVDFGLVGPAACIRISPAQKRGETPEKDHEWNTPFAYESIANLRNSRFNPKRNYDGNILHGERESSCRRCSSSLEKWGQQSSLDAEASKALGERETVSVGTTREVYFDASDTTIAIDLQLRRKDTAFRSPTKGACVAATMLYQTHPISNAEDTARVMAEKLQEDATIILDQVTRYELAWDQCYLQWQIEPTANILVHAAWALVATQMICSDKVSFDITDDETSNSSTWSLRVDCAAGQGVPDYLRAVRACAASQQAITKSPGDRRKNGPKSRTLISVRTSVNLPHHEKYALIIQLRLQGLLGTDRSKDLADVDTMSLDDLEQVREWNGTLPAAVERGVHDMFQDQALAQLCAPAVDAWDGQLTNGELDHLSERLAGRLIGLGIKPNVMVPLCFEKSMWMPVAMLGVLKAGGALSLLEQSFPEQRLQTIVEELNASVILSFPSNLSLSLRLVKAVVQVDLKSVNSISDYTHRRSNSQLCSTAMFAVFTSGSTGKPKGAILAHNNYSSTLTYHLQRLGFTKESRVFDFASYAFDVSVHNVFAALMSGACLCIRSDQDRRNDISKTMADMRVTTAHLTLSVTRPINPVAVPRLQTIVFTGEPLPLDDVKRWWGKVNIVNEYARRRIPSGYLEALLVIQDEVVVSTRQEISSDIVKIPGQRLDLSEVEHWIQKCFSQAEKVVAESTSGVAKFPMTPTGKLNRKRLREIGTSFSVKQLAEARAAGQSGLKRQPSSEIEQSVREIWARVLGMVQLTIGLDDNFFHLGGDSIALMKMVGELRKFGIQVTVADTFHHPSLEELAKHCHHILDSSVEQISPFDLLGENLDRASFLQGMSKQYALDPATIQDAYPCTRLQEGLIFRASKRPGDYIEQSVLQLAPNVSLKGLREAWEQVVKATPILRTRLAHHNDLGLLQLVLDDKTHWTETNWLKKYLGADRKRSMNLGEPLSRFCLAYLGDRIEPGPQFQAFIKYVQGQDGKKAAEYWQKALEGFDTAPFPPPVPSVGESVADSFVECTLSSPKNTSGGITTSMLIRAAWALVLGRMANASDVAFGSTLYGRNTAVAGLDKMVAPTIAKVPVRARFAGTQKVSDYLEAIQQEAAVMTPYEQTGLQQIAATFDSRMIEVWVVKKMLQRLELVIHQLDHATPTQTLSDIESSVADDLEQIWQWNETVTERVNRCIHDLLSDQVEARPRNPAICACE
ncbi:MAG: hypothetical protein Q9177_003774 [Variospora cf. flavescens]